MKWVPRHPGAIFQPQVLISKSYKSFCIPLFNIIVLMDADSIQEVTMNFKRNLLGSFGFLSWSNRIFSEVIIQKKKKDKNAHS